MEAVAIYVISTLLYASILFMISGGLNFIYGVMKVLNFAHGQLYAFGAYVTAWSVSEIFLGAQVGPTSAPQIKLVTYLAILAGPVGAAFIGLILAAAILTKMHERGEEWVLLVTIAAYHILGDLLFALFGTNPVSAQEAIDVSGTSSIAGFPYPNYFIAIALSGYAVALVLWFLLKRTNLGLGLRATAQNQSVASALGMNTRRQYVLAFLIGSFLAGLGGGLVVPTSYARLDMGSDILVVAFMVMVLGGLGSLRGALIGSMTVSILNTMLTIFYPSVISFLLYIVVIVALVLRPQGLFGELDSVYAKK